MAKLNIYEQSTTTLVTTVELMPGEMLEWTPEQVVQYFTQPRTIEAAGGLTRGIEDDQDMVFFFPDGSSFRLRRYYGLIEEGKIAEAQLVGIEAPSAEVITVDFSDTGSEDENADLLDGLDDLDSGESEFKPADSSFSAPPGIPAAPAAAVVEPPPQVQPVEPDVLTSISDPQVPDSITLATADDFLILNPVTVTSTPRSQGGADLIGPARPNQQSSVIVDRELQLTSAVVFAPKGDERFPFQINPNDWETDPVGTKLLVTQISQSTGVGAPGNIDNSALAAPEGGVTTLTKDPDGEFQLNGNFGEIFVGRQSGNVLYRLHNTAELRPDDRIIQLGKDESLFDVFTIRVRETAAPIFAKDSQLAIRLTGINDSPTAESVALPNSVFAVESNTSPVSQSGAIPGNPISLQASLYGSVSDPELKPNAANLSDNPLRIVVDGGVRLIEVFHPSHNLRIQDHVRLGGVTDQVFGDKGAVVESGSAGDGRLAGVDLALLNSTEYEVVQPTNPNFRTSGDTYYLRPIGGGLVFDSTLDNVRAGGAGVTAQPISMGDAGLALRDGGVITSDFQYAIYSSAALSSATNVIDPSGDPTGASVRLFAKDGVVLAPNGVTTVNGFRTITVDTSGTHGLKAGDSIQLAGVTDVGGLVINGSYTIESVPNSSSFTVLSPTPAGASASGGGAAGVGTPSTVVAGIFGDLTFNTDGSFTYTRDTVESPRNGSTLSPELSALAQDTFVVQLRDPATMRMQEMRIVIPMTTVAPGTSFSSGGAAGQYDILDVQKAGLPNRPQTNPLPSGEASYTAILADNQAKVEFSLENGKQGFNITEVWSVDNDDLPGTTVSHWKLASGDPAEVILVGRYGNLTINRLTGQYSYALNDTDVSTQALPGGDALVTDRFRYRVHDGNSLDINSGALDDTAVLTVNVKGTNDEVSLSSASSLQATGAEDINVVLTGAAVAAGTPGTRVLPLTGSGATLVEADPDDAGAGITYTLSTIPNSATQGSIHLLAAASDATGTVLEVNGTFTHQDLTNGLVVFRPIGNFNTQTGSNGSPVNTPVEFMVSMRDGGEDGVTALNNIVLRLNVTAVNDAPVLDLVDGELAVSTRSLSEVIGDSSAQDIAPVTGVLDVSDVDNLDNLTVIGTGGSGAFVGVVKVNGNDPAAGSAATAANLLNANGAFQITTVPVGGPHVVANGFAGPLAVGSPNRQTVGYQYDPAATNLDFLNRNDVLTVNYGLMVRDGANATSAVKNVVIQIQGTNDVPALSDIAEPTAVAELPAASSQVVAVSGFLPFRDVDHGDSVSGLRAGAGDATLEALGSPLPAGVNVTALTAANALSFGGAQTSNGTNQEITYQYTAAATNLDFLKAGDSLRITYLVKVNDGLPANPGVDSNIEDIVITITGTNDVPVLSAIAAPADVAELADATAQDLAEITGNLSVVDLDHGNTLTPSIVGVPVVQMNGGALPGGVDVAALTAAGALTFGAAVVSDGTAQTIGYSYNPGAVNLDFLRASDVLKISYTVRVGDGAATSGDQTIVVTINGTNDGPALSVIAAPAAVTEDADASAQNITAITGNLSVKDLDIGDSLTTVVVGTPTVVYSAGAVPGSVDLAPLTAAGAMKFSTDVAPGGTGPLASSGGDQTIQYTYDPAAANLDFLGPGETLVVTYTVRVGDGIANSQERDIVITINGTADGPVLSPIAAPPAVTEAADASAQNLAAITGDLPVRDGDIGNTLTPSIVGPGVVQLNGGALPGGVDVAALTAPGVLTFGAAIVSTGAPQTIGYTYDPGAVNLDFLQATDVLTVRHTVKVNDGTADSATRDIVITITGTNDVPVLSAIAAPAAVTESADASAQNLAAIAGTLPVQDLDHGNTLTASVVGAPVVRFNGGALPGGVDVAALTDGAAMTLGAAIVSDGTAQTIGYTYDPGAVNLDFLQATDVLTVRYTVKVNDGTADTATRDIVITINGTNDVPVLSAIAAPAAVTEASDASAQNLAAIAGTLPLQDLDHGNTLTASVVGAPVVQFNGGALPGGVDVAALTDGAAMTLGAAIVSDGTAQTIGYTYDPGAVNLDFLQATDVLTVRYTVKVNDGTSDTATRDIVITINGTNDAPAITAPAITAPALSSFVVTNAMLNVTDADHTAAQVALTASGLTNVQFNVDTDNNGSFETNGATSFTLQQVNDGRVQMELLAGVQSGSILATDAAAATSNGGVATAITFNVAPAPAPDGGEPAAPFAASVQSDPVQEEAVAGSSQPILSFPARYDGVPSFEAVRETSLSSYHSFPSRESGSSANLFDGADLDFSGISSWQSGDGGQFQSQALVPLHSQNVFAIGAVAQPSGFDLGENATLGSFAQFSRTEPNWLSKLSPDFEDWQTSLPPLDELLVVAPPVVQYPVPGPPAPAPATMGPAPASAEAAPEAEGGEAVATADTASVAEPASEVPVTPSADDVPVDTPPAAMV